MANTLQTGTSPNAAQSNMISMVGGNFTLPPGTLDTMNDCRSLVDVLVKEYAALAAHHPHDPATATLVYRTAQQLKNLMCDSFILPHGPGTYVPAAEAEVSKKRRAAAEEAAKTASV
jgi:hypothetical protein